MLRILRRLGRPAGGLDGMETRRWGTSSHVRLTSLTVNIGVEGSSKQLAEAGLDRGRAFWLPSRSEVLP